MNTTVVSGQNNMLANYLKADKTRTFKALMQGHGTENYYLGKIADQPSKWKGQTVPMQALRNMQSRSLITVLFDNSLFMAARMRTRVNSKMTSLIADCRVAWMDSWSARSRLIVASGLALCAVLIVTIMLLHECMQTEPNKQMAISSLSIQGKAQSNSDLGSSRI